MIVNQQLKTRRIVYGLFIVIFFIIAPILVLYSSGYVFDLKRMKVNETGVIYINTRPSNAFVSINGVMFRERTPARVNDLAPNTYTVSLAVDGYTSWKNNINVYPNATTFVQGIELFKKTPEFEQLETGIEQLFGASENRRFIAWRRSSTTIGILDTNLDAIKQFNFDFNPTRLVWSMTGRYVLCWADNGRGAFIDREQQKISVFGFEKNRLVSDFPKQKKSNNQILAATFDNSVDEVAYIGATDVLLKVNANTLATEIAAQNVVSDLISAENFMYLIVDTTHGMQELIQTTRTHTTEKKIHSWIKDLNRRELIPLNGDNFGILRKDTFTLVGMPADSITPVLYPYENVNRVVLSPDKEKLLVSNNHEIKVINLNNELYKKRPIPDTVIRLSDRIRAVEWHGGSMYIFFEHNNAITVVDLFKASQKNSAEVGRQKNIIEILRAENSKKIYVLAGPSNNFTLSRFTIQ